MGEDEFVFNHFPHETRHFVAVNVYDRVGDFDLRGGGGGNWAVWGGRALRGRTHGEYREGWTAESEG